MSAESTPNTGLACDVRGLVVAFRDGTRELRALDGVDLAIRPGERVAIVGESGAGKSTLALALMRLLPPPPACTLQGVVHVAGRDLLALDDESLRATRGASIGVVFQDPASALNPLVRVGDQVAECWTAHASIDRAAALERAAAALARVGLGPELTRAFPHELSGGMRQRVQIAMAVAHRPSLLILDEPTTALDTVTREQVLGLIGDLQRQIGFAVLLVTHELALARGHSDRVVVLSHGRVVRDGPTARVLAAHFGAAVPGLARPVLREGAPTVLEVRDLVVAYPRRAALMRRTVGPVVVDRVSFDLARGECLAVVGHSGAGKTTLARALLRLIEPTAGSIAYRSPSAAAPVNFLALPPRDLRRHRPDFGLVFQDPAASLNPRRTARDVLHEALSARTAEAFDLEARAITLLAAVGLARTHLDRLPHQLSGGERQRLCLARALATEPRVLVLDEALSSLDAENRARTLALLWQKRSESELSCLLVTHDLGSVESFADRVAVMSRGRIVEIGATQRVFAHPEHAETRALLAAR